jgi:glycosyltransferase involved in cell wall biosynthesis
VRILKRFREFAPHPSTTRLATFLTSWRPDVVHVNCLPHLAGADAARRTGRPVVWHLREILPDGSRRRRWARRVERFADVAVAVSGPVADWLRIDGVGIRILTVPNGADAPRSMPTREAARHDLGLPADGVVAGLYGQLAPHKGALEFVEAGRLAVEGSPDVRFVLAGDGSGDYVRRVDEAIDRAARPGRIVRLEAQPDAAVLLAASDVVCLTTRTPDPFPRAVLEAMAAARPVAAWRSGGTAEMVVDGRTGVLVDVGDIAGLADAVVDLAGRPGYRVALGEAGAQRVRARFSVERHLDRMDTLFRELR